MFTQNLYFLQLKILNFAQNVYILHLQILILHAIYIFYTYRSHFCTNFIFFSLTDLIFAQNIYFLHLQILFLHNNSGRTLTDSPNFNFNLILNLQVRFTHTIHNDIEVSKMCGEISYYSAVCL